jgi:hypothetical protein
MKVGEGILLQRYIYVLKPASNFRSVKTINKTVQEEQNSFC